MSPSGSAEHLQQNIQKQNQTEFNIKLNIQHCIILYLLSTAAQRKIKQKILDNFLSFTTLFNLYKIALSFPPFNAFANTQILEIKKKKRLVGQCVNQSLFEGSYLDFLSGGDIQNILCDERQWGWLF